ncbi:hypothetical protein WMY93_012592 [Mugilogobius chulae]|uniref:Uncharacterized protein n=1 Tax=Mugilogobius chulae TaxID=88201 RepID=A0AAW0NXH9_9GOBI
MGSKTTETILYSHLMTSQAGVATCLCNSVFGRSHEKQQQRSRKAVPRCCSKVTFWSRRRKQHREDEKALHRLNRCPHQGQSSPVFNQLTHWVDPSFCDLTSDPVLSPRGAAAEPRAGGRPGGKPSPGQAWAKGWC